MVSLISCISILLLIIFVKGNEVSNHFITFVVKEKCLNEDCNLENKINIIKDKLTSSEFGFNTMYNSKLLLEIESLNNFEIIYYRNDVPILFDASVNSLDEIVEWAEFNKDSKVQILNNENFEHLTQAATGSTTGDWMLLFYKEDCYSILPIWEALASNMNQRMMVASINLSNNEQIGKRFAITDCPSIKFLRHGKLYDYTLPGISLDKLTSFANGWYKNSPIRKIPPLPTPFDILTDNIAIWLKENVSREILLFSIFSLIIVGAAILFQLFKPKIPEGLKND